MPYILRHVFILTLIALVAVSCGDDASEGEATSVAGAGGSGQEGEIIGIRVHFYLDESGTYSRYGTYAGSVVVLLPDESEVIANGTRDCLLDLRDVSESFFKVDPTWTGRPLVTVSELEDPRNAMLAQNEVGEWKVIEILK